jgi:hypothetical protein
MFPTLFRISAWVFIVSFAIIREFWRWTFTMSASKKKSDLSQNIYFEIMEKTIEVFFPKLFGPTVIEKNF